MYANRFCNFRRQKCDKEAGKNKKYKDLIIETRLVEGKNKCDTSNNSGNWNHFKIIQNIPEQIKELQKTAILVTAHILRKVLM
jgi:hypothetical protein